MTTDKFDDLALLTAANPVLAREPLDDVERAEMDALLERIVADRAEKPARRVLRRRPQAWRAAFTGAGALALAVLAMVLFLPGGKGADAVAQAVDALSRKDGILHVVTRTTTVKPGGARTRFWTETWTSAKSSRSRSLIYEVTPQGTRGRLLGERVGSTTVMWHVPRDGGAILLGAGVEVRPRGYVLDLLRGGRVTSRAEVTIAGRRASRIAIRDRLRESLMEMNGRQMAVRAYTVRTVVVVDQRTHLPLLLRTSGVVPTVTGVRDDRMTYPRKTTTALFSRFERLTDSAGAAGLKPSRRFRRR